MKEKRYSGGWNCIKGIGKRKVYGIVFWVCQGLMTMVGIQMGMEAQTVGNHDSE